jgi:putative ATP-binding cassette transporter
MTVLSEGEQQALGFARLLLADPPFAFLDNATGALEKSWVERLYGALVRTSITYVSVGNDPTLRKYHDLRLELFGDGGWRVEATGVDPFKPEAALPVRTDPVSPGGRIG